jgi:hypothetical protein
MCPTPWYCSGCGCIKKSPASGPWPILTPGTYPRHAAELGVRGGGAPLSLRLCEVPPLELSPLQSGSEDSEWLRRHRRSTSRWQRRLTQWLRGQSEEDEEEEEEEEQELEFVWSSSSLYSDQQQDYSEQEAQVCTPGCMYGKGRIGVSNPEEWAGSCCCFS